jgi:hypothetical protein
MDFTFGFITAGDQDTRLTRILDSIHRLKIPNYQIIIVGNSNLTSPNLTVIPFDETIKSAWITKKKNIITQHAIYENIIYAHDYVEFEPDYYEGWLKFGNDFQACMTKIVHENGERFTDWVLWPPDAGRYVPDIESYRGCHIPYSCTNLSKLMYFSGTYFVAKKSIMQEIPFDESLCWGQGEDVIWSINYREKYPFKMNSFSTVRLCKSHHTHFGDIMQQDLLKLQKLYNL